MAKTQSEKPKLTINGEPITNDHYKAAKVDPNTMPPSIRAKYDAMVKASEAVTATRKAFEDEATKVISKAKPLPAGKKLWFGYRFGLVIMPVDAPKGTSGVVDLWG